MKLRAYVLTALFGVAVAVPAIPELMSDDFPISTYPMFSGRQSETATIARAEGLRHDGGADRLAPSLVANDEVIQAFETIRQAIAQGSEATRTLCERIAGRLSDDEYASVRIVSSTYNVVDYFGEDTGPLASEVHADCRVEG
ncbi:MAG: hypothetical protein GEU28_10485 [Dehalococcoidia bacterium]|nr:hypothetical protein [Dehalococcoidia bacterium]